MTLEEAREKLKKQQELEGAYAHALGVLSFDGSTIAPKDSYIPRGKTMGILSGEFYKLYTSEENTAVCDFLEEHQDSLTPEERRIVEIRQKDIKERRAIPADEFVAYNELINASGAVWHEAKEKSDYAMFEPYLEKIIAALRRQASLIAPDKDPYDYMLDRFEPGLTQERCDGFFSGLKEKLVPLIEKVSHAEQPDVSFVTGDFPVSQQQELSKYLMKVIGLDPRRSCLTTTEHPFTTDFTKYDVRITTKYLPDNFLSSMFSVIHESGHAMYELHTADAYVGTELGGGVSMAVHESQSRLYENLIGRSRAFIEYIYPELARLFPSLRSHGAEELYRAANRMTPSLIRTEADELTYSMHVMVRYEIERAMLHGEVNAHELPELWNSLYKSYLGVDVPDARRGILQDSHWSNGQIGYFPSYALGSAYGAQLMEKMRETVPVDAAIASGDLTPISAWLEEHIWKYGSLYKPGELMESAMGAPFDVKYYTDYLAAKVKDVYGV